MSRTVVEVWAIEDKMLGIRTDFFWDKREGRDAFIGWAIKNLWSRLLLW